MPHSASSPSSSGDAPLHQRLVRYLPRLERWAHGRLPRWTRTIADTADLVHDVVIRTLGRRDLANVNDSDALAAYLREAVRNRVRDEHRRFGRRGPHDAVSDVIPDAAPSPLDEAMRSELEARYRSALLHLDPPDQDLIVGHLELDYSHEQLGHMTGRTPNAARMALHRAIRRLAEAMRAG